MNDEWDDSAASGAPRQDSHQSWRNKNSGEDGWSDGNSAWSNQPGYGGSRDHIPSQQFSRGRGGGGGGGGYRGSRDGGDRYGNGGGGGGSGYRGSRDGGDRYGNGGGGGGGGGGRNFNQNRRDDKFEVIYVPSMKVGRVIGRGGSKINELQSDSGARIQVTKDTDGDNTIVKIFGNDDCVARAKELIEDLTTER